MKALALLVLLVAPVVAWADCGENPNKVQAAYCAAREAVLALAENSIEQAASYEKLAANEAHEQSTVTGLPGQKDGPNHAPAEAWAWNNAGYIYWLHCKNVDAERCLDKALACAGISNDCKTKATNTLEKAKKGVKPADGCQ